jgi:hypothetical protein
MRAEILSALNITISFLKFDATYYIVYRYQHFGGILYLHIQKSSFQRIV